MVVFIFWWQCSWCDDSPEPQKKIGASPLRANTTNRACTSMFVCPVKHLWRIEEVYLVAQLREWEKRGKWAIELQQLIFQPCIVIFPLCYFFDCKSIYFHSKNDRVTLFIKDLLDFFFWLSISIIIKTKNGPWCMSHGKPQKVRDQRFLLTQTFTFTHM